MKMRSDYFLKKRSTLMMKRNRAMMKVSQISSITFQRRKNHSMTTDLPRNNAKMTKKKEFRLGYKQRGTFIYRKMTSYC